MWKNARAAAIAIAPLVIFGLSSSAFAQEVTPRGSVVTVTTSLGGAGQDHMQSQLHWTKPYWDEIYDYVIEQDTTGNLVPGLATSWTPSADHLTWTFVIREGVKFHTGDTLSAEDVAWSWNRLMFGADSKSFLTAYAPDVEFIKADGPTKLLVKTKAPKALLPLWFSRVEGNRQGAILSKKYVESVGIDQASRFPIGSGPYKFVSQDGEQSVTLVAFDDPARSDWQKSKTPGFKNLTVLGVPEVSTRLALLKTGAADLVPLSLATIDEVSSTPGLRVLTVPSTNFSGIWCFGFTLNLKSPCNDKRVREALSISIDRQTIADVLYQGQAQPSGAWYGGPGSFGYPNDIFLPPFDPERARQLLVEAGFGEDNPLKVEIVTYNDDVDFPMLPTLAEAIVGYYQDVGVDASIKLMEWEAQKTVMFDEKFTGQRNNPEISPVTLFMRGMDNRYYFPAEELSAYTTFGRFGRVNWDNTNLPEQAERLGAVGAAFDLKEQEALFADYYKWMAVNYNHIPLLAAASVFGVSGKIKDWKPVAGKPFVHHHWTLTPSDSVPAD